MKGVISLTAIVTLIANELPAQARVDSICFEYGHLVREGRISSKKVEDCNFGNGGLSISVGPDEARDVGNSRQGDEGDAPENAADFFDWVNSTSAALGESVAVTPSVTITIGSDIFGSLRLEGDIAALQTQAYNPYFYGLYSNQYARGDVLTPFPKVPDGFRGNLKDIERLFIEQKIMTPDYSSLIYLRRVIPLMEALQRQEIEAHIEAIEKISLNFESRMDGYAVLQNSVSNRAEASIATLTENMVHAEPYPAAEVEAQLNQSLYLTNELMMSLQHAVAEFDSFEALAPSLSGELAARGRSVFQSVTGGRATSPQSARSKLIALFTLEAADRYFAAGRYSDSEQAIAIAENLAEIGLGLTPIVGLLKDCYEAIFGVSVVTGELLDADARFLAIIGISTLGYGDELAKGIRGIVRLIRDTERVHPVSEATLGYIRLMDYDVSGFSRVSADTVNEEFKKLFRARIGREAENPWQSGTDVFEFELTNKRTFWRLHVDRDKPISDSPFVTDVIPQPLTPSEAKDVFALPRSPDEYRWLSTIHADVGQKVRIGVAGSNKFGEGGAIQIEMLQPLFLSRESTATFLPSGRQN
ncbi:pre-toxin TG domain-containing protein [uncultured Roseobacter sp.]|uniref:pre-toxin TG domain-containing protein n=1 Tax=uncultured Roseobacter sp. TaxID=114847 RepID=UPI0026322D08|nr:pre-toxin TG domain-containing protein [uncultured Roseobacter sp.]